MPRQNRYATSIAKNHPPVVTQVEVNGELIRGLTPLGRKNVISRFFKNIEKGRNPLHDLGISGRYFAVLRAEGLIDSAISLINKPKSKEHAKRAKDWANARISTELLTPEEACKEIREASKSPEVVERWRNSLIQQIESRTSFLQSIIESSGDSTGEE